MFTLTRIGLDDGQFAVYINGNYLGCNNYSVLEHSLTEVFECLSRLPGVRSEVVARPVPEGEWEWFDVANDVFRSSDFYSQKMTVSGMISRLQRYPLNALCIGTFWMSDDFLYLESTLDETEIEAAMELAYDNHDANVGFNWDSLQFAIDEVRGE